MTPIFTLFAWTLFVLSVPVLAFLKLRVSNTYITATSFLLFCSWQGALTALTLWATSLFGPLTAGTLFMTLLFLVVQTVFKLIRLYAKG